MRACGVCIAHRAHTTEELRIEMTFSPTLAQEQIPLMQSTALFLTIVVLIAAGLVGWLVATVIGFARARFNTSARWLALSSLCLLIYHLQWIAFGLFGRNETDPARVLRFGSFFNLFVFLGSIFAIIGFLRLNNSRAQDTSPSPDQF
ncbi:MAG: hypothetical protein QOE33_1761 [Acidobacteriota bacterium]|nr:hypothetical protein [Acidobacteriota bacterium]